MDLARNDSVHVSSGGVEVKVVGGTIAAVIVGRILERAVVITPPAADAVVDKYLETLAASAVDVAEFCALFWYTSCGSAVGGSRRAPDPHAC